MGLPANNVEPKFVHVFPSEKDYFDTSSSTVTNLKVTVDSKTGKDYGVKDPKLTVPVGTEAASNGG